MKTISNAQQKVIDIMLKEPAPFHFIPWGLNYYHLWNADHEYRGRVRHCTFDALVRKELIEYDNGWHLASN